MDPRYSACAVMVIGNDQLTVLLTVIRDIPAGISGPFEKITCHCPFDGDVYAVVADALLGAGYVRIGTWSDHTNGSFCDLARVA